jgi:hypothetical protein
MVKQTRKASGDEIAVLNYLNELRDSGQTNMFGATPYIELEFGCTKFEAKGYLMLWMNNFNEQSDYTYLKT